MQDRLAELKGRGGGERPEPSVPSEQSGLVAARGIEMPLRGGKRDSFSKKDFMSDFFKEVEAVKEDITAIRVATKEIAALNESAYMASTAQQEAESSEQLAAIINRTNQRAGHAKGLLKKLKADTEEMRKVSDPKRPEIRIRENLSVTLTRKFVDMMKDYQNSQQNYKTAIKKKVRRQVQIVKPDVTAEEVDVVLRSGDTGQVYRSAILNQASDPIKNAYANAVDKYQDVLRLEQSMQELHQMFLDFALLTEQQGEMLDQIEYQVKSASDYIDEGNEAVVKALEHQKSLRKKQCCFVVLVVCILFGILFGVGAI